MKMYAEKTFNKIPSSFLLIDIKPSINILNNEILEISLLK